MRLLRHRSALTALAAAVALLAAGCGIQSTGAITAGSAPLMPGSGSGIRRLTLYYLLDGRLTPVQRTWNGELSASVAVQQLFQGPTASEQEKGFFSLLPTGAIPPVKVDFTGDSPTVTVTYPLAKLQPGGMNQIACTTVAAMTAAGDFVRTGRITLVGPDMTDDQLVCGVG
ncbi:hypothetical protein OG943_20175 [Amycolatopsis sp. NBC_00345]|uniref:hypothetical protein n=1 Tax=Amycolatopsis sp. NBC_00345 TaxID=2975955 RepID=UPI002E253B0B